MTAAQDADRPRLFISYRHNDANRAAVLALKQALESEGVDVWLDEEEIAPFGDIFAEMRRGLVEAKAVMAYYCDEYSGRRACQWELTSAMIVEAHEAVGTAPPATLASRLLVVMPTAEAGRLRPKALRGNVILSMQEHDPRHIAQAVRARLASIDRPLGAVARYQTAPWVGISPNEQFQRFVGRLEEMWDIFDALSANAVFLQGKAAAAPKGGTGTARLQSWGGVGKSVLAAHYARTYAPFYPGGVFWLHAGASLSAWQQRILAALRPVAAALPDSVLAAFDQLAKDYPAPDETLVWSRPMIGAALAERGKPYLWIVDDLPEGTTAEQRNAWLAPDERGFGRTLFTTRDGALTTIGTTIALNMLDGDSAYDLLTFSRAPSSPAEEAAARDFLVIVDRYALVIDVAGQLVETHYFRNFAELLETARHPERDARVLAVKDGLRLELPGNANPNIVATLLRSFDFVASLADGETALDILRVASLLAPGVEIPHDLLDAVLGANLGRARHHLVQASLARTGDSGLTIHPVICRAVALTSPQDRLEEIRAHAIAALTRQLDAADDILQLPSLAPIIPHVEVLAGSITTMAVAGLVSALGGYHFAGGRSHLAVPMFDQVYRTYLDRFGPDHPDTLTTMGNLAKALREQGNFGTARQLQQSAWDLSITVRGAEDAETVALKSDLAATLRMQGEFAVARRMCQEVLDTRLRILGPRDRATLACMSNLAGVLRAQGRLKEALELQDRALLICQTDLGEENFQTLVAQNNVSETLRDLGDYPRARELQAAVVGVFERSLGKEHPGTLTAINNLALTLLAERLTEQAHQLFSKALETSRRALGPEHPDTLRTMINLATAEHNLGNDNGAKSLIEETLAIYEKNVGKSHPVTLTARSNYAEILAQTGDLATARRLQDGVLRDRTTVLGPNHPSTLVSMVNLAGILLLQHDAEGARILQERALDLQRTALGPNHPTTVATMEALALTLQMQERLTAEGNQPGARQIQEQVLEIRRRTLGPDHPLVLTAIRDLEETLAALGDRAAARTLDEQALAICRNLFGPDHTETIHFLGNLAENLMAMDEWDDARPIQQQLLETCRRAFGEEADRTLIAKSNLASTLVELDELEAAEALQEEVLAVRQRGPADSATVTIMHNLAITRWERRNWTGAKELWEIALPIAVEVLGDEHPITTNIRECLRKLSE